MNRVLALVMLLVVSGTSSAQDFSWFTSTMTSSADESAWASVLVLPQSAWIVSDSAVTLSDGARASVILAREKGKRVLANVPDAAASGALDVLWSGDLDGIVVPPGSLTQPVSRPEFSVVLSAAPDEGMDGWMADVPGDWSTNWTSLDSTFSSRAASSQRPTPERGIVRVPATAGQAGLLMPGSILLEGEPTPDQLEVLRFRKAHPAIAAGLHRKLSGAPYSFYRAVRTSRDSTDEVLVVFGATGRTVLKVSAVLEDDTVLREVRSGQIGLVSFGQIAFNAPEDGILLIEVVQ